MKGIVLVKEYIDGGTWLTVVCHGERAVFASTLEGGVWRASLRDPSEPAIYFGPVFSTKDEARALCRAAAVALAEGTGGVFGESRPLKVGDRVTYLGGSPDFDGGIVTSVNDDGFGVKWDDEDDCDERGWADIGIYVTKADEAAEVKPEAPSGPKVGMRVKIINPSDADWGDEGVVDKIYDDGFSVAWDDGKWAPCVAADFGKWVGPV